MSFVVRLTRSEFVKFYRSLYNKKLIYISKPLINRERNKVVAKFGIKLGCKKFTPFKEVIFTDFSIQEFSYGNIDCVLLTEEIINIEWRKFMYEKFGEEYAKAIEL